MVRNAQENDASAQKLFGWARSLLLARNDVDLPHTLVDDLRTTFAVPQATLRLWGVDNGSVRASLQREHSPFQALAYSPDGKVLAAGGVDNLVTLWNVSRLPER